jgi:hypothetical protein
MLAVRDEQMFVSSNDNMSVTLWHRKGAGRQGNIVMGRYGTVITGAEDGDLVMLQVPDGEVLTRNRYNWGPAGHQRSGHLQ